VAQKTERGKGEINKKQNKVNIKYLSEQEKIESIVKMFFGIKMTHELSMNQKQLVQLNVLVLELAKCFHKSKTKKQDKPR
jgi:uncharacterized membrane protein